MTMVALAPMDLAALLCSRVCHDVISPVGAIVNGLEVLEDEKDPEMRAVATELIKKSAASASARLQFCRLAFGAAGSLGATIDTGDAETVMRGVIPGDRTTLAWNPPRQFAAKNKVKLLLNLCLIAQSAIPRGGVISVDLSGQDESLAMRVRGQGPQPAAGERGRRSRRRAAGERRGRRSQHPALLRRPGGARMRHGGRDHRRGGIGDLRGAADRRESVSRSAPVQSFLTSPRQDRRAAGCASTRGDAIGSRL